MAAPQLPVRSSKARDLAQDSRAVRTARLPKWSNARLKPTRQARRVANRRRSFTPGSTRKPPQILTWMPSSVKAVVLTRHRALISLDTNVVSETLRKVANQAVMAWLRFDAELA